MAENENNEAVAGAEAGKVPQLALQRIYIKDMSFESPQAPTIFLEQGNPQVKLDIGSAARKINEELFEVILTVTATATRDEKTVYLVEIQQAGAFAVVGIEGADLEKALTTFCPNVLFPYLRESVDGLLIKGGFPPLHLAPMNFEAIYAQAKARQQQEAGGNSQGQPEAQSGDQAGRVARKPRWPGSLVDARLHRPRLLPY